MPSKIRVRHGRQTKRKKWPKGHACESNPATRKFRNAAKSSLALPGSDGNESQVKSSIADFKMTAEHEDSEEDIVNEIENLSLSGVTNLTTFSHCTNTSFISLENLWTSRLESHQDICAVLAAVTQVIKANGGTESDTDYFGALSAALESADNLTTATSVSFLLSIIINKVPDGVLQSQYSHLTKLISAKFDIFETNEDGTSLMRSLLACLSTLLAKQSLDTWQETFTQNMFYRLLQQTISSKPKIRRIAHHGMTVLTESALVNRGDESAGGQWREPIASHPIWKMSSKFFQEIFQTHTRKDQIKNVFHLLNLLKFILHLFPSQQVKHICECILKCSTSKNHLLHTLSFRILQTLFMHSPHITCLTWQLNSQIVQALCEIYPKPHEADLIESWLGAVQYGLTHLSNTNPTEAQVKSVRLFGICFEYLKFCHSSVIFNRIVNALQIVIEKCLIEHKDLLRKSLSDNSSFLIQILAAIQAALLARNPDSFPYILQIQATTFRIFNKDSSAMIKPNIQFLAVTVKNWPEIANHSAELEQAISVAAEVIGVEKFIEFIPLKLTGEQLDFSNSWLLPFLKSCIKNEEISYFKDYFIPMATEIRHKATQFAEGGDEINAKICETLESQIWDLLPPFFKTAIQVPTGFPLIARLLGTMLQERVDLRNNIATALRQLIEHHINDELAMECVRKYSKNYLPILFNLYIECEAKHHNRAIVLGCLSSFVKISPSELVDQYFNKIGAMLNSSETDETKKPALLDIGASMLPYINSSQLELTLKQTEHYLTAENHSLQKKGYLALERILNLNKEEQVKFIESNVKGIKSILLSSVSKLNPTSKKHRLKCLFSVLHITECKDDSFITSILPEVILSMKETNVEVRNIAYNILLLIGKFALESGDDKQKILESFVIKISAGLSGSEHMQSCTILCLGKLVHEFRFSLSDQIVGKLLRAVYTFSESTTRQIIKYCLYFINVLVSVMSIGFVMEHLKIFVTRMLKWNKNANNQFLIKVKVIIEKMLRKVDLEHVSAAFPHSHKNLLRSVRKSADKRKRQKDVKREKRFEDSIGDTESNTVVSKALVPAGFDELMLSDEEIERDKKSVKTGSEKSKGKQKKTPQMWIREDETEDPIDLLDPQSSARILTANPKKREKIRAEEHSLEEMFSFNEEGKLIVTNEKRSRKESDSASEAGSIETGMQSTTTGISSHLSRRSSVKKARKDKSIADGREYKSKKAGGDMKRRNKPDPYAYLPLNKGQLRIKRKQKKLQGSLKAILKKASKGSAHGRRVRHMKTK